MMVDGKEEIVKINLEVNTIEGLSAHSGRNELLAFLNKVQPKPKRIIINHGEVSKCLDLASTLYKLNRLETLCPKNLETVNEELDKDFVAQQNLLILGMIRQRNR